MCGILGLISADGGPVPPDEVSRLLPTLGHRGPDGSGVAHGTRFAFGHARLAIIAPGHDGDQPMSDASGRVHITYNGEIYNYRELRAALIGLGYRFRTTSDTEVILNAYQEWGIGALAHLDGMFAFGLYDEAAGVGYLVRDRLGIKPVFYARTGGAIAFCSELPGIVNQKGFAKRLNLRAVSSYLSYRHVVGDETYYEGVHRLEPGTYLRIDPARVTVCRYWNVDTDAPRRLSSPQEATEALREALAKSVRQHLVADVPVALFLSGGIDSSIILREATRAVPDGLHCFTARVGGNGYDEAATAAATAHAFGAEHEIVDIDPGTLLTDARALVRLRGEPLGMHNEVAMYRLARAVRGHAKVVLCGEGADELFAGYGRIFRLPFDQQRLRACDMLPEGLRRRAMAAAGVNDIAGAPSLFDGFMRRYGYFSLKEKWGLLRPGTFDAVVGDAALIETFRRTFAATEHRGAFDQITAVLVRHHLPGLLQMVDGTTMAASIEGRVPFLDHRIVQLAFDMPPSLRLRWRSPLALWKALFQPIARFSERADVPKFALRTAYRDDLPDQVINGRKMGFPVPLGAWLMGAHGAEIHRLVLGRDARLHELLDRHRLRVWFDAGRQKPNDDFGRKTWLLTNLELFLREHF